MEEFIINGSITEFIIIAIIAIILSFVISHRISKHYIDPAFESWFKEEDQKAKQNNTTRP